MVIVKIVVKKSDGIGITSFVRRVHNDADQTQIILLSERHKAVSGGFGISRFAAARILIGVISAGQHLVAVSVIPCEIALIGRSDGVKVGIRDNAHKGFVIEACARD